MPKQKTSPTSTIAKKSPQSQIQFGDKSGFHLQMAEASALLLIVTFVGCKLKSVQISNPSELAIALLVALAAVVPLPLYWQEKGRTDLRDAAMTIPWALLLAVVLPFSVDVAARLNLPLWDERFARLDQVLGISVPSITIWASHNWLGHLANRSYPLLIPLLPIAFFGPALTGKVEHAQGFLISNLTAFAVGVPAFAFFPAVGPWYGYHFAARPDQLLCQSQLLALRLPGAYAFQPAGIVCFPSFHVVWAILCARALWAFRPLRIPVAVLSGMIILSTMTTGWHYFSDVLAGIAIACLSIAVAKAIYHHSRRQSMGRPELRCWELRRPVIRARWLRS